ncbi:MAG: hypothetical protein ABL919_06850 [Methylococcales bacterium]|nr:hypothetical protein [Methylococcaceae bacterium]
MVAIKLWAIKPQEFRLTAKWFKAIARFMLLPTAAILFLSTTAIAAEKPTSSEMAQARNYVLAACIMERYAGTPIATEADAWAGGLVENGSLSAESYTALAQLAKSAPAPGITQNGIPMRLQSCVEFINSREFAMRLKSTLRR